MVLLGKAKIAEMCLVGPSWGLLLGLGIPSPGNWLLKNYKRPRNIYAGVYEYFTFKNTYFICVLISWEVALSIFNGEVGYKCSRSIINAY